MFGRPLTFLITALLALAVGFSGLAGSYRAAVLALSGIILLVYLIGVLVGGFRD